MLDPHFPRDQKHEQFQEDRGLVLHHLVNRLATALQEGGVHFPDGVGVQGVTRAVDVAANSPIPSSVGMGGGRKEAPSSGWGASEDGA